MQTFKSAGKAKVTMNGKTAVIEVNRDAIGKLLAISTKFGKNIDFTAALAYPLTSLPLSLSNPDGSRRVTQKSKLMEALSQYQKENDMVVEMDAQVFVVDFIAQIRVIATEIPETYEQLALKVLRSIPKGYQRVDLVSDTYRSVSIKAAERNKRGCASKVSIKSGKSKIPREFSSFMQSNKNKNRLIDIIFDFIIENRIRCLQIVEAGKMLLSRDGDCHEITESSARRLDHLSSNQEEADTKVILHTLDALQADGNSKVHLRSPSKDTDILVLAIALIPTPNRVFYDSGGGKNRKCIRLDEYDVPSDEKEALIGFHAVTGNDYTSAFFGKGKQKCWKVMLTRESFVTAFKDIGNHWDISDELVVAFEKFVCKLYGCKSVEVNKARYELFQKKYTKENKIIDLALLPPCRSTLMLHLSRCNYVACLWKASVSANLDIPTPCQYGWTSECNIQWVDDIFPTDYEELLTCDDDSDNESESEGDNVENYDFGPDEESEDSDDDF